MTLAVRPKFAAALGLAALITLGACTTPSDVSETPEPLGDFRLGYNIVVTENAKKGPLSRSVPEELIKSTLTAKIQERLGRYEGSRLYHIGVNLDGYILAVPGVPIVGSPKSVMVISVNVWDDAKGKKINKPQQITVLEQLNKDTIVGSGLTQSKEQQLENLATNAAAAIENYLRRNPEWFRDNPPAPAGASAGATNNLDAGLIAAN
ncbi:hypothetical protein [Brevirhabdus sp.]|uniref:hypothetical protein n=1 Tax=Brevirhabdus sp. TaxID=2004514 RepID=UPI0040593DF4